MCVYNIYIKEIKNKIKWVSTSMYLGPLVSYAPSPKSCAQVQVQRTANQQHPSRGLSPHGR
jgi:hypothetical protein